MTNNMIYIHIYYLHILLSIYNHYLIVFHSIIQNIIHTVLVTCAENQFRCTGGGYNKFAADFPTPCIAISWQCDGEEDCTDGTDESDCKFE